MYMSILGLTKLLLIISPMVANVSSYFIYIYILCHYVVVPDCKQKTSEQSCEHILCVLVTLIDLCYVLKLMM